MQTIQKTIRMAILIWVNMVQHNEDNVVCLCGCVPYMEAKGTEVAVLWYLYICV